MDGRDRQPADRRARNRHRRALGSWRSPPRGLRLGRRSGARRRGRDLLPLSRTQPWPDGRRRPALGHRRGARPRCRRPRHRIRTVGPRVGRHRSRLPAIYLIPQTDTEHESALDPTAPRPRAEPATVSSPDSGSGRCSRSSGRSATTPALTPALCRLPSCRLIEAAAIAVAAIALRQRWLPRAGPDSYSCSPSACSARPRQRSSCSQPAKARSPRERGDDLLGMGLEHVAEGLPRALRRLAATRRRVVAGELRRVSGEHEVV